MEKEKNFVNKYGKTINPLTNSVMVETIDFKNLNKNLDNYLKKRFNDDSGFYRFDDSFCGIIDHNGVYILISKDCVFSLPLVLEAKKSKVGFILAVYEETENTISHKFDYKLEVSEFEKSKTGTIIPLPEFMGERYKYNGRIQSNELSLLDYLSKKTKYFL